MAFLNFDATQVAPDAGRSVIPAGVYIAQVTESDVKTTKSGGEMLTLTWQILDGEFKNRKVFDRINLKNHNATAQAIGQSQLSALCHVLQVLQLRDSSQLHGRPCKIKVVIKKSEEYGDGNEVKAYEPVVMQAAPQQFAPPPAQQAQPQYQPQYQQQAAPQQAPWSGGAPGQAPWG